MFKPQLPQKLYHATPSCYVKSIKKFGLGGKMPKTRFWDYSGTPYENIRYGCFLATDEYVAESYVESSEAFEELSDIYEDRYGKELGITVFEIDTSYLNLSKLSIDTNNSTDDADSQTYFYDGVIPFSQLKKIKLYEDSGALGKNKRVVNESQEYLLEKVINECVHRCLKKYLKENAILNETKSREEKEQMLIDLYNYLSQEPTDDIYDGGQHGKGYLNINYKAYNYFEPKGIVHNVWAVHYTNLEGYEGIQSRGFRFGVSNYDALAYSQGHYNNNEQSRKSGWSFALPIDNKYLGDDLGYGDCGFIIKTDGVRAYHKGDKDDEIIFKGCMVKKKIPFLYDEDYECWILPMLGYGYNGGELPNGAYYCEELDQVVFEDVYSLIRFVISR